MLRTLTHLITPPASEPLTLGEAKAQLRLETADDDAQVNGQILAARMYVEEICWRGLVTQVWELVAAGWPHERPWATLGFPFEYGVVAFQHLQNHLEGIELPKGNLVSVGSVKYIDTLGVQQTLVENTDYVVDTVSKPGRVRLAFDKFWPEHRAQWDAVRIQYTVGWSPDQVPQPLKQAMLLLVSHFYENRTLELPGRLTPLQFSIDSLMAPYSLKRFL